MPKIYVVTCGSYSDYRIEGIFTSRYKAKRYISKYNEMSAYSDGMRIETYTLNEGLDKKDIRYNVSMDRDGGTLSVIHVDWHTDSWKEGYEIDVRNNASSDKYILVRCIAEDVKHAVKIANERRTQLIANGEWD